MQNKQEEDRTTECLKSDYQQDHPSICDCHNEEQRKSMVLLHSQFIKTFILCQPYTWYLIFVEALSYACHPCSVWALHIEQDGTKDIQNAILSNSSNSANSLPQRALTTPNVVHVLRPTEVENKRSDLPIVMMEQEIMEAINENTCVIVCGETGCGKTTQVPQVRYSIVLYMLPFPSVGNIEFYLFRSSLIFSFVLVFLSLAFGLGSFSSFMKLAMVQIIPMVVVVLLV